jgi:hypothetical protein
MNFQDEVVRWMMACFGEIDPTERTHRFVEESIELAQSCGATKEEVLQLVEYVFSRPTGNKFQEVGGVLVTLAGLCSAQSISMELAGATALIENQDKTEKIRAKRAMRPADGPLPVEEKFPCNNCGSIGKERKNCLCGADELCEICIHSHRCDLG